MCRDGFKKLLKENPIKSEGREELVIYFCEIHNIINKQLKKEVFDCKNSIKFWGGEPIKKNKN